MSFGKFKDDDDKKNVAAAPVSGAAVGSGAQKSEAFLGKGTKVIGSLTFNGPVELDGHVEGEVHAKDSLTIGESAVVNAKVHGSEIVVKGNVTGDIIATKRLSIKRPAKVTGNIASPTLSIEDGVHFEGRCSMNVNEARLTAVSGTEKVGAAA